MKEHALHATPTTVHWGHFDSALPPVLVIDPGDEVVLRSVSGSPEETPTEGEGLAVDPALRAIHAAVQRDLGPHILTGPIAVRGADPGDALRIAILDVALTDDWGFKLIKPDLGALPETFPYGRLIHLPIDLVAGRIRTPFGIDIMARPFFGVMGAAPARSRHGRVTSVVPGSFGGSSAGRGL